MKLACRWSEREEEGRLSKADVAILKELAATTPGNKVWVLDFLQDNIQATTALYNEIIERPWPRVKKDE